jgi:hypothetical protein
MAANRGGRFDRHRKSGCTQLLADGARADLSSAKRNHLRTDDGGKTWKDQENNVKTNLFAISVVCELPKR